MVGKCFLLAVAVLFFACGEETSGASSEVAISLMTDWEPRDEWVAAEFALEGREEIERFSLSRDDFSMHRGLLTIDGLAVGASPRGELRLLDVCLDPLASVEVRFAVLVDGTNAQRVTLSRLCEGVSCGRQQRCLGGQCVPSDCLSGFETSCPDLCAVDADCPSSSAACGQFQCTEFGVCAFRETTACDDKEVCSPSIGCTPRKEFDRCE